MITKKRLVLPVLASCAVLLAIAGCGSGGESSPAAPDTLAPPGTALFAEGTLRPGGSLKENVESLAQRIAGIDDLGGTIVSKIEEAAGANDKSITYSKDVEPWLGEKAGVAFGEYGGGNFSDVSFEVQSTDTGATEEFVEKVAEENAGEFKEGSFEGIGFESDREDGSTFGVVGDFLVFAQSETGFKQAVEASEGESLADVEEYKTVAAHAPGGSLLDLYVNISGLIEQAGNQVDPQTEEVFKAAGIDLNEAAALLSLVPGSESLELDIAAKIGGYETEPPATGLLESMPADSLAAFSAAEYGKHLEEGIDGLDATGIPGQVPPHQLKSTLKRAGIDLDAIAGSLEDAAVFVVGSDRSSLGGAAVLTTRSPSQAKNTIANIGLLLRANHTPGVTALSGKASGFSIRSSSLGPKPVVIAAEGERIVIGYGLPATLEGLRTPSATLAENAVFGEAKKALGGTPMTGFVDGPAALKLAEGLIPSSDHGFREARPYLTKIGYIGFGGKDEGGLAVQKLIVGLKK